PSPPSTMSSSHPSRHCGVASLTSPTSSGSGRSAASYSRTRTPMPSRSRPFTTSSALRMAAGRPVWVSRKTVQARFCVNAARPQLRAAYDSAAAQPFLTHLELRLDHHHQIGVRLHAPHQGGQYQAERDEGQIPHDKIHRLPIDRFERQFAYVRTVLDGDAFIA